MDMGDMRYNEYVKMQEAKYPLDYLSGLAEKLKPCGCGGKARIFLDGDMMKEAGYVAECEVCGIRTRMEDEPLMAVAQWNAVFSENIRDIRDGIGEVEEHRMVRERIVNKEGKRVAPQYNPYLFAEVGGVGKTIYVGNNVKIFKNVNEKLVLTKRDRLILYNQFKILSELYPGEDYERLMKIVECGYAFHYGDLLPYINEDEFPVEESQFVIRVLDMYSAIYSAWGREKKGLQALGIQESDVIFPGFDGNNETSYLAYCEFFIDDLERFQDIKKLKCGEYNGHSEMCPKYRNMVKKWEELPAQDRYMLSKEFVADLVNTGGEEQ